jgi:hypothetical protein
MARAQIYLIATGLDKMIKDMQTVGQPPTHETTHALETALGAAFEQTQETVHIGVTRGSHLAGTLKASGRVKSDLDNKTWSGSIEYGGRHGTPAYYAIYEMNRGGNKADGTPHDFFSGLDSHDEDFEAAIDHHFKVIDGP